MYSEFACLFCFYLRPRPSYQWHCKQAKVLTSKFTNNSERCLLQYTVLCNLRCNIRVRVVWACTCKPNQGKDWIHSINDNLNFTAFHKLQQVSLSVSGGQTSKIPVIGKRRRGVRIPKCMGHIKIVLYRTFIDKNKMVFFWDAYHSHINLFLNTTYIFHDLLAAMQCQNVTHVMSQRWLRKIGVFACATKYRFDVHKELP